MRADRRKITDRRRLGLAWQNDRRLRPDRRLNNISVEWISHDEIKSHPNTWDAFCSINRKSTNAVQLHDKGREQKEPSGQTRYGKQRAHPSSWELNIFKRTQRMDVEQRAITDRRTKNLNQPFERRVRPDRRLNNISLEWITFE